MAGFTGSNRVFNPKGPLPSSDDWPPTSRLVRVRERKERPDEVAVVLERSIVETANNLVQAHARD